MKEEVSDDVKQLEETVRNRRNEQDLGSLRSQLLSLCLSFLFFAPLFSSHSTDSALDTTQEPLATTGEKNSNGIKGKE